MTTITVCLEFDYGHRLIGHEGKCKHLHGHRGRAEITVEGPRLDTVGRVIDFSVVKKLVGGWIDEQWDHNMIMHEDDPVLDEIGLPDLRKAYQLPCNPTAENLAAELFHQACKLLPTHLKVVKVKFWETPSCCAEFSE